MRLLERVVKEATTCAVLTALLVMGCGSSSPSLDDTDTGTPSDAPADSATATLGDPCSAPGALACNGKAQKLQLRCDGGKWVANGTCPGQQVCDPRPGPTQGSCQDPAPGCGDKAPGAAFCDGAIRHTCGDDLLSETSTTCKSAAYCAAAATDKCAACLDGESTCDGPSLKVCAPDHQSLVAKETCATSALCVPGETKCRAPACDVGGYRCTGDILQQCNDARTDWKDAKHCGVGLCDAASKSCLECASGSKGCAGNVTQTCDSTGHWSSGSTCSGSTPICNAGVCAVGVCSTGDYRCTGDALETCNAASTGWTSVSTCSPGMCDAVHKDCADCKPGDVGCKSDTPQSCDATRHWLDGTPCSGATPTCSAGACVASVVTTVTFPSTTSTTHDALSGTDSPLGPGGIGPFGGRFGAPGSYVQETFTRAVNVARLDISLKMYDGLGACASGATLSWDVKVNGVTVGTYEFTHSADGDVPISKSFTFAPIAATGGGFTIRYEATTTLCSGSRTWNWYAGGTATMQ